MIAEIMGRRTQAAEQLSCLWNWPASKTQKVTKVEEDDKGSSSSWLWPPHASSGPMCWRTSSTSPGSSLTPSSANSRTMRWKTMGLSSLPSILTLWGTLGCLTCNQHHHHHHHHYYVQDFGMLHLQGRRAASSLASCFSQFAHKSTTVFQVVLSFALSFVFLKYSPGLHTIKQTASLLVLLIAF